MPPKSKRRAKKARTPKPQSREPEVLGDDTHDGVREPLLDALSYVLEKSDGYEAPARKAIVAAFGGTCDAAREHEVLLMVKRDARFRVLASSGNAGNRIALADVDLVEVEGKPIRFAPVDATGAAKDINDAAAKTLGEIAKRIDDALADKPADVAGQQTLGDLVKDAEGRPLRIPWKHDIGSHVLLLTDGHPPSKATIRNIHAVGNGALYDLNMENGGQTNEVPAYRIGRDLDAEGELESMRLRLASLERHIAKGEAIAKKIVLKQAQEREQAETLSKTRKDIEKLFDELADHERSDAGQTDLRDVVGEGDDPHDGARESRPEYPSTPKVGDAAAADTTTVAQRLEAGDVIKLADCPFDAEALAASRIDRSTASTGKPQQVRLVAYQEHDYVLADVQGGVAVLLPAVDAKGWERLYLDRFGEVLELPSSTQSQRLSAGGALCGMPVKVGRAKRWLGPEEAALLLELPSEMHGVGAPAADAEPVASGKDAAAGTG